MSSKPEFDVFLAHNSKDKDLIEEIAERLEEAGLHPWFDKHQILGGDFILDAIQKAITQSKCAAFFIGIYGLGLWQNSEMRSFIQQSIHNGLRVIPVLLPGTNRDLLQSEDFLFLCQRRCILFEDFSDYDECLEELIRSIRSKSEIEQDRNRNKYDGLEQAKNSLEELLNKKSSLERRLVRIKNEIRSIESYLMSDVDPSIRILVERLSDSEQLAKRYADLILKQKKFRNLRHEVEEKGKLNRLYLEIKNYLERISISLMRDNMLFLREPRTLPTLADSDLYESASADLYRDIFDIIKKRISDDLSPPVVSKLEAHFDYLAERLLACL